MGILNLKKTKKEEIEKAVVVAPVKTLSVQKVATKELGSKLLAKDPIIRQRITEKASLLNIANVYTFEIKKGAGKRDVADFVEAVYKVKPVKVRIVVNPRKKIFARGKSGYKGGVKKAYVQLKEGDKIEVV